MRIVSFVLIPHLKKPQLSEFWRQIQLDLSWQEWRAEQVLDLECQRCFIIIHHPKSFSTFKGSLSKALWGVIKRGRPDRWFVTYGSFDQWLATIPNHRHSTGSNGRPLSQKLYHWSMVMSKTRIYFVWHWNSKGEFARRPAESPWLTGQRAEVSYNDDIWS